MPRPSAPKPRQRDHAQEAAGRATSVPLQVRLTPGERAAVDALATALGAPLKQTLLAAVRAATVALDGGTLAGIRRELRADLEPTKPGPKVADDES